MCQTLVKKFRYVLLMNSHVGIITPTSGGGAASSDGGGGGGGRRGGRRGSGSGSFEPLVFAATANRNIP